MKKFFTKHHRPHLWKQLFFAFLSAGFVAGGLIMLWLSSMEIPDFDSFAVRRVAESTKIYDRTGEVLLYDIHDETKRTVVPFEDISLYVKNATVAIEDAEFYQHNGIKPKAFLRAIFANLGSFEFAQGGSTITQQVVKNSILTPDKKISRKIKEWILALKLEKALGKEEILALYLNESPYGGAMYGIEQASLAFFGKRANEITLPEAAYLASIPQAPTYYSPYGNHRDDLDARKNLVLAKMLEYGFITQAEHDEARTAEVVFLPQDPFGIKAPHFVIWIKEQLEKKYGEAVVRDGGLKVITTLDYRFQQKAEEIVARFGESNETNFNAKNAGMMGIDPKTGQVLVMVGSRNYFDHEKEGNFNVTLAKRQPGSAFKPFIYATAFMKGYTPETVLFDLPTEFQTTCGPDGKPLSSETNPKDCYSPQNYDEKFRGPMTLRGALAQSINIPAVKLLYLSGIKSSIETARRMGITSLKNADTYGLTLVLGGAEVSLFEMTSAYGVFANGGVRNPPVGILKVEDKDGTVLEEWRSEETRVIDERVSYQISDILSDNEARTPTFGARSALYFEGRDVAVKTGTTNDYRDTWIVGYTPSFALGAWAGNNDNTSIEKKVAGLVVAPMWNAVMHEVLPFLPNETFPEPEQEEGYSALKPVLRGMWQGGQSYFIDTTSGKLATEYTPKETREEKVVTSVHSILYWLNKSDPHGAPPLTPESDSQFLLWETPVRAWATAQGIVEQTADVIPKEYDNIHTEASAPRVDILSPVSSALYSLNQQIMVRISTASVAPITRVEAFVDNIFIGTAVVAPFEISFIPEQMGLSLGEHELRITVRDSAFNTSTITRTFFVN